VTHDPTIAPGKSGLPMPPSEPNARSPLSIASLETVYDALATAIDEAGPERSELFLVKLALLNAQAMGEPEPFLRHVKAALQDLDGPPRG
jgi:hypothetical protein